MHPDRPNVLLWLLGGFVLDIASRKAKPVRLKCATCDERFEVMMPGARGARAAFYVILVIIVIGVIFWYRNNM